MQAVFTEWLEYGFMKNALLAVLIITPLFGILGTMIVNKKMAFFSDSLGHSALTGIAIGAVLGMKDTTLSMILFAIVFALLLNKIAEKSTASTDTLISVFSSASMALGLAILSKGGNFSKYSALLVGDILSITRREILYLVAIFAVTLVFWVLAFNKLCAESVNVTLAKSKGIPVKVIENLFSILIALIVMLSIKWIGILSQNMREYHFFSVVFSIFSGVLGLLVSYYTNVATGPMIVLIASVIYFSTYAYGRRFA